MESHLCFGGNIQTGCHQGPADPTHQTEDYNNYQQNNHLQKDEASSRHGQETVTPVNRLKERRGNCPMFARLKNAHDSIDPLVKRTNYADSLRKQRKTNIIASKRLQQQRQQQDRAAALSIRVLSANIRGLNSDKKQKALADLIEEHKVNLVHLQETKLTKRLWISNFTTAQTQLRRNGGSICSSAIAGSRPIKALGQAVTWLIIEHQGVPIHAISIYVEPGNADQADKVYEQTASIIKSLKQRTKFPRVILSGDFNQDRPRYDALAKAYNLTPSLAEGTQTHAKGGALDQLYTNLDICCAKLVQLDQKVSDHSAVFAELRFMKTENDYVRQKDAPIRRQWRLKEAAASETTIKHLLGRQSILRDPATSIVTDQVKPQRRVQRWYDAKHINKARPQETTDVTSQIGERMDKHTWQQTLKILEQHHREGQWKDFHQLVRKLTRLKPGSSPVTGLLIDDQTILDQDEVEAHIATYYANLYKDSMSSDMGGEACPPGQPFCAQEIADAAASTNFNKGLGPDLFDGRILAQNPTLKERVLQELADMLNNGQIPGYLREGRLVALSKRADRTIVDLDDIRPIIVRSHLAKIAEKAIKKRIEEKHPHILKTKASQTGFKAGKSTGINIVRVLKQLHPGKKRKREHSMLLLIDLRKAFDSVDKDKLFAILQSRCKSDDDRWLVHLIKQLHSDNSALIGEQRIAMRRGVMQGSVLAPLLFNIYLEEVLLKCPTLGLKYEQGMALGYADDLLVICKDTEEAKRIIEELEKVGGQYNLLINKPKSQLLGGNGGEPVLGIPHVSQAKYLGAQLRTNRKDQKEAIRDQIDRNLACISSRLRGVNNDVKEALLGSYAKSLLIYFGSPMRAAALWKQKDIRKLEERLYRKIHRVPNDVSTAVLMNLTADSITTADTVERLSRQLLNQANNDSALPRSWHEKKSSPKVAKRAKLYMPRALTETILALTRGRTIVYFGHTHFCNTHQSVMDDEHMRSCSHIGHLIPQLRLINMLRDANIHEWNGDDTVQLYMQAALLKSTLNMLTSQGVLTIQEKPTVHPADRTHEQIANKEGDGHNQEMHNEEREKRKRGRPRKQALIASGAGSITHYYQTSWLEQPEDYSMAGAATGQQPFSQDKKQKRRAPTAIT